MTCTDKFTCYNFYKQLFEANNIEVLQFKEINYGLQFTIVIDHAKYLIRIYESKKGIKLDLSQVKKREIYNLLQNIIGQSDIINPKDSRKSVPNHLANFNHHNNSTSSLLSDIDEYPLIGIDESGKGDYFGPLVIAGVFAEKKEKEQLRALGVIDSKKLNDEKVSSLARKIKELVKFNIVVIGNKRYNELYKKINNLNKLLAWGHARVIENLLNKVECNLALSDQFGNTNLIENALLEKGKKIRLEQKVRAEENVVVAAASILARATYVDNLKILADKYNLEFPKGASNLVKNTANEFIKMYGQDQLNEVAKLHFRTTEEL